jgi:hypothetical protein
VGEDDRGHFTDDELERIVAEFIKGNDDLFFGRTVRGSKDRLTGFCVWCKREVSPAGEHSPHCEGQARQRLAAKALRMRRALGGDGGA